MANEVVAKQGQAIVPESDNATMMTLISRAASDPNIDIEKMERLFAMKERMDAKDAEAAFNAALSRVQQKMGRVAADKQNKQTNSMYATYAALDRELRPLYTDEGFSLSFGTEDAPEGTVGMVCYVSHAAGHTRTYHAQVPSDGKGAKGGDVMTKTHAFGSGASYGMRYLLKMIFNVAIGEDDDDGNAAGNADPNEVRWIAIADAVKTWDAYKAEKAKCVAFFGSAEKVPKPVAEAFNQAMRETRPKDE